jgi:uncharacterized membrane protein YphA (DoxX/SURF4 family)
MKRGLLIAGRLILAGIFLYSGYAKLREPWLQFVVSLDSFKILPENTLEPIARTMPWLEVALGVALLSGFLTRWFALIATVLLGVFVGAAASAYSRGLAVDCGCFGSGGDPLGPKWFAEHGAMLALAVGVMVAAFAIRKNRATARIRTNHAISTATDIA